MGLQRTILELFITWTALASFAAAYENGVGITSACTSMTPGHGYPGPQNNLETPYTLTASVSKVARGGTVEVTLASNGQSTTFRGFMLQARVDGSDTPVGTWSSSVPSGTQRQKCSADNDMVSHSNKNDKSSVTFTWEVPTSLANNVTFYVSVVRVYNNYWAKLPGPSVHIDMDAPIVTQAPTTAAPPGQTTKNDGSNGSNVCRPIVQALLPVFMSILWMLAM